MRTHTDYYTSYLSISIYSKLQIMYNRFWYKSPISPYWILVNWTHWIWELSCLGPPQMAPFTVQVLLIFGQPGPALFLHSAAQQGWQVSASVQIGLSFCLQVFNVCFNMKACQLYCKGGLAFCQHRLHNASPLSPCSFEWCLSSAQLPHSLCPGPSNMGRLIEVKVEKRVESQMAFYLLYKTNKCRVGPLPFRVSRYP